MAPPGTRGPRPATPNWFIALPVSPAGWFDERVTPPPSGLRRFHPEDLHVTLVFLGGVGEAAARAAWAALPSLEGPWAARLGHVRPMGNPRRYSALSAVFAEGGAPVEAAMTGAGGVALAAAGLPPEPRPALAHVTLARPGRRASEPERAAGLGWARGLGVLDAPLSLDRVALYTWSDTRADRLFRIVEERRL